MNSIGMKMCRRCRKEKNTLEFFNDDRGNWCMICNYEFLLAYGEDEIYADAREFTHPNLRSQPRSPVWVLERLREGLDRVGVLPKSNLGFDARRNLQGQRMADATRLIGERALMCDVCEEKFGGESVFKAHRKYGTTKGRPAKDAMLKCYSLENTKYRKDENGVWRGPKPNIG